MSSKRTSGRSLDEWMELVPSADKVGSLMPHGVMNTLSTMQLHACVKRHTRSQNWICQLIPESLLAVFIIIFYLVFEVWEPKCFPFSEFQNSYR